MGSSYDGYNGRPRALPYFERWPQYAGRLSNNTAPLPYPDALNMPCDCLALQKAMLKTNKAPLLVFLLGVLVSAAIIVTAVRVSKDRRAAWEAFKVEHHCKITDKMAGDVDINVGMALNTNGDLSPVMIVDDTPSRTGWLCDDGVTYWK